MATSESGVWRHFERQLCPNALRKESLFLTITSVVQNNYKSTIWIMRRDFSVGRFNPTLRKVHNSRTLNMAR